LVKHHQAHLAKGECIVVRPLKYHNGYAIEELSKLLCGGTINK